MKKSCRKAAVPKKDSGRIDISKLDSNMAPEADAPGEIIWMTPDESPLELVNFPWRGKDKVYRRMPLKTKKPLPPGVEELCWHTAGGQIRFMTDSRKIYLRASLHYASVMYHMAQTGALGFDLYLGGPLLKTFTSIAWFNPGSQSYQCRMLNKEEKRMRECVINFPLYSGVIEVEIGFEKDAVIKAPTPWADPRPIVAYGTSILQGGCAARPGMCCTNILSRKLNRPFLNFGFSGNGRGEPQVAEIVAGASENPAMFILDYDANALAKDQRENLPEFIRIIRKKHRTVPILLISRIRFSWEAPDGPQAPYYDSWRQERTELHESLYKKLRAEGDRNIHFLDGNLLLGPDFDECTVDGIHPTDLGFIRMAKVMEPEIRRLLSQ